MIKMVSDKQESSIYEEKGHVFKSLFIALGSFSDNELGITKNH